MDCEWNDWDFGECSVTCGGGTRTDKRTLKTKEMNGGFCDAMGGQRETSCNTIGCPGNENEQKRDKYHHQP